MSKNVNNILSREIVQTFTGSFSSPVKQPEAIINSIKYRTSGTLCISSLRKME